MIMDNQVNNTHTFINNNNFNNANSLTHLLDTGEPEVEVANIKLSEYCDISTLSKSLQNTKGGLSILSLNSQSLSAIFDDFEVAIEQLNKTNAIDGGSNYDSLFVRTVAFPVQVAYWIKEVIAPCGYSVPCQF